MLQNYYSFFTFCLVHSSNQIREYHQDKKQDNSDRAPHLINLGITNRRLHDLRRTTITGRVALSLISPSTSNINIPQSALKNIGCLVVFLSKYIVSNTPKGDCFKIKHPIEREYVEMFCRQLGVTGNDTDFVGVHAISILVNRDLNPHYDSMNPTHKEDDFTFSVSVQIETNTLSEEVQHLALREYGATIPLCIVMYKRKALYHLCDRSDRLEEFVKSEPSRELGRSKLRYLLESTYSDADFVGNFFNRQRWDIQQTKFKIEKNKNFEENDIPMLVLKEAVDKMGYWSSFLHLFYQYAVSSNAITLDRCLEMVVFFGHQCNGTYIFTLAMRRVLLDGLIQNKADVSLYKLLAVECCRIRKQKYHENAKDVGSGRFPRHQTSGNVVYSSSKIKDVCKTLIMILNTARKDMILTEAHELSKKYKVFNDLIKSITDANSMNKLDGIGNVRAMNIVHLCSLIGLIPLDFYVHTPLHNTGGPGVYLREYHKYDANKTSQDIIHWSVEENRRLHEHFTTEFTGNHHENAACIIGRRIVRKDLFFYLPWYNIETKQFLPDDECQLMFRINGYRKNKWTLECYNGGNKVIPLHSADMDTSGKSIIQYKRLEDGRLCYEGHVVKHDIFTPK